MLPRVDIISITKDDPAGLRSTLASIFSQTLSVNSVIVVYSGDSYADVLQDFPSVLAIRQTGTGISDAFNIGLDHLSGDAVVFLNGGDAFDGSGALLALAEQHSSEVPAISGFAFDMTRNCAVPPRAWVLHVPRGFLYLNHQATLYNRRHVGDVRYDRRYRMRMDLAFNAAVFRYSKPRFIDRQLVLYQGGGLSNRWSLALAVRSVQEEFLIMLRMRDLTGALMVPLTTAGRLAKSLVLSVRRRIW